MASSTPSEHNKVLPDKIRALSVISWRELIRAISALLTACILACSLGSAAAQQIPRLPAKNVVVPRRLELLIDQARALPPEFAADALLRLAAASEVGPQARQDLLLEAFETASRSRYSVRERGLPGYEVDTPDGYLAQAFELGLDELSLKSRAVAALVKIDQPEAMRLFERTQAIRIPHSACGLRLVTDPRAFYELPRVLTKAFTAKQRKDGDDVLLLTRVIYTAHSMAQAPFISALVTEFAPEDRGQLQVLVGAVAASLEQMDRDDLIFRVYYSDLSRNVFRLADLCAQRKISNVSLLTALRSAIVRQLSGDRCQLLNALSDPARFVAGFRAVSAILFPPNSDLRAISVDDLKPASVQAPPDSEETFFRSARSGGLLMDFRALRTERKGADYNEAEWGQHLDLFLSALQSWGPADEPSERTYFHEKSVLYEGLPELGLPADEERKILQEFLAFVGDQRFRDLGIEWFLHAKELLPALEKAGLKDELLKDPVLGMYSRLATEGLYQP
jgi:hypothetical protein